MISDGLFHHYFRHKAGTDRFHHDAEHLSHILFPIVPKAQSMALSWTRNRRREPADRLLDSDCVERQSIDMRIAAVTTNRNQAEPPMNDPTRTEDVLGDRVDGAAIDGQYVRKGSVGAFVDNANRLDQLDPGAQAARTELRHLVPSLPAVGVFDM